MLPKEHTKEAAIESAKGTNESMPQLDGKAIVKAIYSVPNKIVNLVVR